MWIQTSWLLKKPTDLDLHCLSLICEFISTTWIKYSDWLKIRSGCGTLFFQHDKGCPKFDQCHFYYLLMCLKNCRISGKQCRPRSDDSAASELGLCTVCSCIYVPILKVITVGLIVHVIRNTDLLINLAGYNGRFRVITVGLIVLFIRNSDLLINLAGQKRGYYSCTSLPQNGRNQHTNHSHHHVVPA